MDAPMQTTGERRFAFGANWRRYLARLTPERIALARASLRDMLGDLAGQSFLDVGSGSGLFSLAARQLGACVYSFDYDPDSVACTAYLRQRYYPGDPEWTVGPGSVRDTTFLATLPTFDVVYAWGVLHHTGAMWQALDNIVPRVRDGGRLFVSLYNDQGKTSRRWLTVKRLYQRTPRLLRPLLLVPVFVRLYGWPIVKDCLKGRPLGFGRRYREGNRGMSVWCDLVDWVGGYPFEVARPEDVVHFCRDRGLVLGRLKTVGGGLGCNEFVFLRQDVAWGKLAA